MKCQINAAQNGAAKGNRQDQSQVYPSMCAGYRNRLLHQGNDCRSRLSIGSVHEELFVSLVHQRCNQSKPAVSLECKGAYFSFDPIGTSSRKPASTGLPSSPTEAATIMPFDSSPRSLRGCRLATMTTLRPMSDSGS